MTRTAIFAALAVLVPAGVARADAGCEELRQRLGREHDRAVRWDWEWGIGLGALAVGQAVAAPLIGDHVQRDTFYAGGASAAVGAASSLVLPLAVVAPAPGATCAELQAELLGAGHVERTAFYLDHVGGLVVNVSAALVLAHYTDAKSAGLSFAVSYAVTLARTYTMPRWAWHPTFTIDPNAGIGAGLAGTF